MSAAIGASGSVPEVDAWPVTDVPSALAPFHDAGVFGAAELHGAGVLADITGDDRPETLVAAALALRAPQHGHVCVDLHDVSATVVVDAESPATVEGLPWPATPGWLDVLSNSPLVRVRPEGTPTVDPAGDRPLVLVSSRLYLDRYWRYERRVAEVLRAKAGRVDEVDIARVREVLDRVLPAGAERPDHQRLALATAALRQLTVVAGGPGTGKTHAIARLLVLLEELAGDDRREVAVVAPTGKAADRLTAAVRAAATDDDLDTTESVRDRVRALEGMTIHRLLGWRPGRATRFRHDRHHKLPHRVVVVDETSMVDLPLMSKLLEALDPSCKLVLVGDPDQLASIQAGAVLADVVGPSGEGLRMTGGHRDALVAATGEPLDDVTVVGDEAGIDDAVVVLRARHRFRAESGIGLLAAAIHHGDGDTAVELLRAGVEDVTWLETGGEAIDRPELEPVRDPVVAAATAVRAAARAGDAAAALAGLDEVRVLTAHRRGLVGVTGWIRLVEHWVEGDEATLVRAGRPRFGVGRAVMVTQNDRRMRLFNGDVGVVVRRGEGVAVAFHGRDGVRTFAPSRLQHVTPVEAMTIHKSQGSQFRHVVVVLPDVTSRILTRELLYTAVTRAEQRLTVVGPEDSLRAAIERRVARASGLRTTLWEGSSA